MYPILVCQSGGYVRRRRFWQPWKNYEATTHVQDDQDFAPFQTSTSNEVQSLNQKNSTGLQDELRYQKNDHSDDHDAVSGTLNGLSLLSGSQV